MSFNPDDVGVANGNIFGFPVDEHQADIVIIPIPWDVTASYGKGTSNAPAKILEASTQLDFFHPELEDAHLIKVHMTKISQDWKSINDDLLPKSYDYIHFLESGGDRTKHPFYSDFVQQVNVYSSALADQLHDRSKALLQQGKSVAVLGGEHSVPLGLLYALNDIYSSFGILQIDAHADLRNEYEGFSHSHASIMFNVLRDCSSVVQLTQVGIRDISSGEVDFIKTNSTRVKTFFDWELKDQQFRGVVWHDQVKNILETLPKNVYVSFDIDGLSPDLCPHTGTPVAGGLSFDQARYLLFELVRSGRTIIGFDLNEVGYNATTDWDANVGARVLWNLVCATAKSAR